MEIIETITVIISLLVTVVIGVIAILIKLNAIKNVNAANDISDELIALQNITEEIKEFAVIAEANGGTGEEKKQFVLNSIKAISEEYDWEYDELIVESILTAIIDLTKKINVK